MDTVTITGSIPRFLVDEVSDKHPIRPAPPRNGNAAAVAKTVAAVIIAASACAGLGYHAACNLLRSHVELESVDMQRTYEVATGTETLP